MVRHYWVIFWAGLGSVSLGDLMANDQKGALAGFVIVFIFYHMINYLFGSVIYNLFNLDQFRITGFPIMDGLIISILLPGIIYVISRIVYFVYFGPGGKK